MSIQTEIDALDRENLAEEIESLGLNHHRQLVSRRAPRA